MNVKEARQRAERCALALGALYGKTYIEGGGELSVDLRCVIGPNDRWQAVITAAVGTVRVLLRSAAGDDPTAAVLALPDVLAREIESQRQKLESALREDPGTAAPQTRPATP